MASTTTAELRVASQQLSAKDFTGTIRSYYPFWDAQYRPYLVLAVEALPADHFDFKPRPDMFTAKQIVLHIAEAERGWIHHVVDGAPDEDWVVAQEDRAQGWKTIHDVPDRAALLAALEDCHRHTQHWLEQPIAELGRSIPYRLRNGTEKRFTLHWILDHVQEHEIHHRAQLNLYLRLLGIEPPSI